MDEFIRHLRVQIAQEEDALSQFMLSAALEQGKRLGKLAAMEDLLKKMEAAQATPTPANGQGEIIHDHDLP